MYISRLKLRNWKNIKQSDNPLQRRVYLIGPNASGKSNYLDALRFLRDVANDGLSKAVVTDRGGVTALRCLSATKYSNIDVEVTLSDDAGKPLWNYRLVFNQDSASRPIVKEEVVQDLVKGTTPINRPDEDDKSDPLRLTFTALQQVVANKEFRDIADFFQTITYQHLIPQVVRDPRGFSPTPVHDDPYGRDFLLRLWKTASKVRNSRLAKIKQRLQVAVPQLQELQVEMDEQEGNPHLVGKYSHWRPHDARQSENQFSDGTLRLLGMCWAVFEGQGPLLLEEPEISLHAEVVRYLPQLFELIQRNRKTRRQFIISTHSEELLSDPGITAEEVLRLEPSQNGTLVKGADDKDKSLMKAGLTAAEVLLPKSAPPNVQQLVLEFDA